MTRVKTVTVMLERWVAAAVLAGVVAVEQEEQAALVEVVAVVRALSLARQFIRESLVTVAAAAA